jgi:hypothetical protein
MSIDIKRNLEMFKRWLFIFMLPFVFLTVACQEEHVQVPKKAMNVKLESETPAIFTVNHEIINSASDAPETSATFELKPGHSAVVKVEAKGCHPEWRTIQYNASGKTHVESFDLKTIKVPCLFTSPNGKVAAIAQELGEKKLTPCHFFLDVGKKYRFSATAKGFHGQEFVVDTTGGKVNYQSVDLRSNTSTLVVNCTPAASIRVNKTDWGETPVLKNNLKPGLYEIVLSAEGYKPKTTQIEVIEGEEKTVHATLEPLSASLRVVTEPKDARVYVNGVYRGSANPELKLVDLDPSTIMVSVEKNGYTKPAGRYLMLTSGKESVVEFNLEKLTNSVSFSTSPAEVEVYLDRKYTLKTKPLSKRSNDSLLETIELPVGKHELRFVAKNYEEKTITFTVEEKKPVALNKVTLVFKPNLKITLRNGMVYKGALIEENNDTLRLMTKPGVIMPLQQKDIELREIINVSTSH